MKTETVGTDILEVTQALVDMGCTVLAAKVRPDSNYVTVFYYQPTGTVHKHGEFITHGHCYTYWRDNKDGTQTKELSRGQGHYFPLHHDPHDNLRHFLDIWQEAYADFQQR